MAAVVEMVKKENGKPDCCYHMVFEEDDDSIVPISVSGEWRGLLIADPDKFQIEWSSGKNKVDEYLCAHFSLENFQKWIHLASSVSTKILGSKYTDIIAKLKEHFPDQSDLNIHMNLISRIASIQEMSWFATACVTHHEELPRILNFVRGKMAELGIEFTKTGERDLEFHHI